MNLLLLGRRTAMGSLTALLLATGVWASWDTARLLAGGPERGVLTVTGCGSDECAGWYVSAARGAGSHSSPRQRVVIERSIAEKKGVRVPVALRPGTREVVRAGGPGFLHALLPLGGALLLASVVVAGGLRLPRVAWGFALAGAALLTASFLTLTF
ncbi:hypothetical protein [Streptomyces kanamyceticus]|uniref:Uncharacterized protein n=1 Tax=Streptomyces kanamyceticus TaxID=1967 RepID=A0A5J6GD85_STRKN|nr:hypothetical protein [Streptomyces kanamyceticus]QEU93850.1 hypothetical protein CP970_25720 [Streptomyces kanamyceticus]